MADEQKTAKTTFRPRAKAGKSHFLLFARGFFVNLCRGSFSPAGEALKKFRAIFRPGAKLKKRQWYRNKSRLF